MSTAQAANTFVIPVEAVQDKLNNDKEFLLKAKFWYCDIRFVVGDAL